MPGRWRRSTWAKESMGSCSVVSNTATLTPALRSAGVSVAVFDTTLQDPIDSFAQVLRRHRPGIVVIYEDDFNFLSKMCLTSMRATAKRIADIAQDAGAIVIAHGSDASDHAADYLAAGVDYVLTGEAEQILAELCSNLLAERPIGSIPGVLRRDARGNLCLLYTSDAAD